MTLCGGTPTAPQSATLGFGAHIAVGTPGRILKHLEQGTLELDDLKTLVLDEADRMLDMGFGEDINRVISHAPRDRQTLLFSATYPEGIAQMSRGVQRNPVEVSVSPCTKRAPSNRSCMKCRPASASMPSPGCSATTNRAPAWCSATPSAPATTWPITWPPRASRRWR